MSWYSWLYLVIVLGAIFVLVYTRLRLKLIAKPNIWLKTIWFSAGALDLIGTWFFSRSLDDLMSGVFVGVIFIVFGFWRQGLTATRLIAGASGTRQYTAITRFELTQIRDDRVSLAAFVGSVRIANLNFSENELEISNFFKDYLPTKALKIQSKTNK